MILTQILDLLVVWAWPLATILFILALLRPLFSPLRSVPGPFVGRWTDGWYLWRVSRGNFEVENRILHDIYGPIVRYGPNRYSISDPDASRIIYGHGTRFPKSSWYKSWASPGAWSIFADQSIDRHATNRRLFQNTYSMTSLVTYEPYVDQCADLLRQRLAEASALELPIDMGHWFQCYAFDVIGLITYATRLGFLDRGEDIGGVMGALDKHLVYATLVGIYSRMHRCLYPLNNYLAGKRGAGRAFVLSFTADRIAEHQAAAEGVSVETDHGDNSVVAEPFLTKFMARNKQDPTSFTPEHVVVGCAANMVAGSDTTAITLSAILYYLLKTPKCFEKLKYEVDQFQAESKLSKCPTFKESHQMPYLQAVIQEAMRIHPATGLPLERVVPPGGAVICGRFFPEGSIVGINSWVMHRNQRVFGEDVDVFRPERWQTGDAEQLGRMNRHWMPFGLGSRTCIGRHISMLEISKLIPCLIRDFDFELPEDAADPNKAWSTNNYWFVKPIEFKVKVTLRTPHRNIKAELSK